MTRFLQRLAVIAIISTGLANAQTEPMNTKNTPYPKVIFFDVNETLLDLKPLKDSVTKALSGHDELIGLWFSTMLHYSLVDTLTGKYHSFPEIGVAALQMVAESNGIELSNEEAEQAIVPAIGKLPPHPDVIDGLKALKKQGFILVSLTNSSDAGVKKQFENAGLIDIVDRRLTEQLEQSLGKKYPVNKIQSLLEPFEKLGRDREFWNHTLDGIAVLGPPGLFQVYGLQPPVPELAGQSRSATFPRDGERFSFSMGRRPHTHRASGVLS